MIVGPWRLTAQGLYSHYAAPARQPDPLDFGHERLERCVAILLLKLVLLLTSSTRRRQEGGRGGQGGGTCGLKSESRDSCVLMTTTFPFSLGAFGVLFYTSQIRRQRLSRCTSPPTVTPSPLTPSAFRSQEPLAFYSRIKFRLSMKFIPSSQVRPIAQ